MLLIIVQLTPNLSKEHCISISKAFADKIPHGVPAELMRDYGISLLLNDTEVFCKEMEGNYQRVNIIEVNPPVCADQVQIRIIKTNGAEDARIFEVRLY